jgi:hypothetical protein
MPNRPAIAKKEKGRKRFIRLPSLFNCLPVILLSGEIQLARFFLNVYDLRNAASC